LGGDLFLCRFVIILDSFEMLTRLKARILLSQCRGNEIWSPDTCRQQGVPATWIEELSDTFESGFNIDTETIYIGDQITNHYHGVRDLDIAYRLAEFLGVDASRVTELALGPMAEVRALQEAVDEH
jgi:hypothetical protein